ncbi:hypothetical protein GCM10008967_32340 [Bacillus carboniphilus]|uniref:SecDF P1 head subdomain domain-containing protein n=1 Tax=Bacillus carboniphilus TaxID=86663 RepID=A0ABN0WJB7_9BACI
MIRKIIFHLILSSIFTLLLTGCNTSNSKETREITIQNEDGEVLATTPDFESAQLRNDENHELYIIEATFKDENKLEELTTANAGKVIQIYLGEELISSATISKPFSGQAFIIEGGYTDELAVEFVNVINSQ